MPITSIPVNDRIERFVANAGQTVFSFDFPIYAPTDLEVRRFRAGTETLLAYGGDYSVTGAGEQAGGTITLTAPAQANDLLVLRSNQPVARTTDFEDGGDLPALSLDTELNRFVISLQQQGALLAAAMRRPDSDSIDLILPAVADRANKVVGFDGNGNLVVFAVTTTGAISATPFGASLIDDASQVEARATLGIEAAYADLASQATANIGAILGQQVRVTGTTTITSLGVAAAGTLRRLRFAASLTLTHNATSLILPGGVSIVTAANDTATFISLGSGNWLCTDYTRAAAVPSGIPIGATMTFAGATAPSGWLFCFGQTVSRTTYAGLFAAIGTTYGAGDGSTTFALPDARGRALIGKDDMGGTAANRVTATGTGNPGVNGTVLGAAGGVDRHTLTLAQAPAHDHGGGSHVGTGVNGSISATGSTVGVVSDIARTIPSAGGGEAHPNLQPSLVQNIIIFTGVP
jgi:microcystin-dependent protein